MASIFGRTAVITGAASGIGRACALRLASRGARVILFDLDDQGLEETQAMILRDNASAEISIDRLDVSDRASVNETFESVVAQHGTPKILVNSAGITRDNLLHRISESDWDTVLNVNLKGTFLLTQIASKYMIQDIQQQSRALCAGGTLELRRGEFVDSRSPLEVETFSPSIINISSIVGKIGNFGQTNYAASKSGVVGITKTTARELGRYGIRVNAIQPGFIRTPMTDMVPEKVMQSMLRQIPLGRMGTPDEIAGTVEFLASQDSSYLTGAVLEVSGGFGM